MRILLTVAESADSQLPMGTVREFVTPLVVIGRKRGNAVVDLALMDRDHRISRKHAEIRMQDGRVLLEDHSGNGTYLNALLVGKSHIVEMRDGDYLQIADYSFQLTISRQGTAQSPRNPPPPAPRRNLDELSIPQLDNHETTPDPELTPTLPAPRDEMVELDITGFNIKIEPLPGPGARPAAPPIASRPSPGTEAVAARPGELSAEHAWAALVTALGLKVEDLPIGDSLGAQFVMVGGLLRQLVESQLVLLRARQHFKAAFGVGEVLQPFAKDNPFKYFTNVEAALIALLSPERTGFLSSLDAVRASLNELHAHQMASTLSVNVTLDTLTRQFDPDFLEKELLRGEQTLSPFASKAARLWNAYCTRYTHELKDKLSIEAFCRLYLRVLEGKHEEEPNQSNVDSAGTELGHVQ